MSYLNKMNLMFLFLSIHLFFVNISPPHFLKYICRGNGINNMGMEEIPFQKPNTEYYSLHISFFYIFINAPKMMWLILCLT